MFPAVVVLSALTLWVTTALALGVNPARGEEVGEPGPPVPTAAQTLEAIKSAGPENLVGPETDLHAAQTMPHRELDRSEALGLAEAVFGPELEGTAGIYEELDPERYLSNYAAIVPASTLPEGPAESGEALAAEHPDQSIVLESSLPLRTENASGEMEAVDLELEHSEGELQPANPLTEVGIPLQELGEGISLPGPEVQVTVPGAPAGEPATDAEGRFAFYPEVAEDTDLIVVPTAQGVETLTDIRSAEAPMQTSYDLELPTGAELRPTREGGAEVVEGGQTTVLIPPPTATDAAGNPVRTELSVQGGRITVEVTPDLSTAMPILVDPAYILTEHPDWAFGQASMAGWTSGSTNPSATLPVPYWIWNSAYPGLDLSSGFGGNAHYGDSSSWGYTVPRYGEDVSAFGKTPSTWLYSWTAEDVFFAKDGNSAGWPALVWGTTSPTGWNNYRLHSGGEAEWNTWFNQISIIDEKLDPTTKSALMALVTYEEEDPAKRRDAYIGASYMGVADEDAPTILKLEGPTHWVNATAEPITYAVEDAGLGVKSSWASFEGKAEAGWGFELPCVGTNASPCSRIARSGTAGKDETQATLHYDPTALPTGKDQVAFAFGDPIWGLNGSGEHATGGLVELKIDHTPPEISLSGPLTEQETEGTTKAEYPLEISVKDGTDDVPQSGVKSVEVKVDGKKVTMANETPWHPNCATQNCRFSGIWTLKSSEYTPGAHEVEVIATDAVGLTSTTALEVELGQEPLQTSFTTAHPTFEAHEISTIGFKATREGKPVEGATFECSLDGSSETPTTPCISPFELPEHLEEGWHTLLAAAVDKEGHADPTPARWRFDTGPYPAAPASEKLLYPEEGKKTASWYTLEAEWGARSGGEGVTGVSFEMELPGWKVFKPVPAGCVIEGKGKQVSWPLPVHSHPGHSGPVYLKVRGCAPFKEAGYPEKEIRFRAVFDGGPAFAGASAPSNTEFVLRHHLNAVPTDATESIGPATVDLLTGSYTISKTDVSIPIPGSESNLEFTRVYNSGIEETQPGYSRDFGGQWQPSSPLESEGEGEAWTRLEEQVIEGHGPVEEPECWTEKEVNGKGQVIREWEECAMVEVEGPQPKEEWLELFDNEGAAIPFEISGGRYIPPSWDNELVLTKEGANFVLSYPNGTHTIFVSNGAGSYLPKQISFQATPNSTRMVYETHAGEGLRLEKEIAGEPGTSCKDNESKSEPGCRTLEFDYFGWAEVGGRKREGTALESIVYYNASGNPATQQVVAHYEYGAEMQLTEEWDPRLPSLRETYTYSYGGTTIGRLASITPPGEEPWKFEYYVHEEKGGIQEAPLKSVGRGGMTTTIAYRVPVSGTGAPYNLSAEEVARWGQSDLPVDATAVFPPTHVPAEYPPSEYTGATIHYMDPEGHQVNVASPSPPGVSGASITTTETNVKGDVVRQLGAKNRLLALESPNPAARSHELDTHSVYNAQGTELLESWGPLHPVRLESGETVEARAHTVTHYDEGEPTPPAGTPPAYLPTKETVAAVVSGKEGELEPRTTETHYNWALRKPTETIVDPGGLNIRSVTVYYASGQVFETRQPKNAEKGAAGSTQTFYYSAGSGGECLSYQYAGLPCKVLPTEQAEGTGRPKLLVKKFTAYNYLDQPTEVLESPGGGAENIRTTTIVYDSAGRTTKVKVGGGGTEVPATTTEYSTTTGLPEEQSFVCELGKGKCGTFNPEATKVTYNSLGQVKEYEDADGNVTKTTYDAYGRPLTTTDARGSQTIGYDPTTGLPTTLEVPGVGTFTARYDADGNLVEEGLPDGLARKATYNVADEPTGLTYTKTSSCGESCTWFQESVERGIRGQILTDSNSLASDRYAYDKVGRLSESFETPTGGGCTTRAYTYDADSNRLTKTTREPAVGGACASSGGTTQSYKYDEADRLTGSGLTYDAWGRIESLPATYAGGSALTTHYFSTNMVATQSQGGVTNSFQLDASGRQRQREQTGGVAGTEVFHYDGPGDSPSWTALGSAWSRNVAGIGGELAAIQESSGSTTFKLTDLHGDVVASASSSPTATKLLATYRFDEFGEPESGAAGRFGWLGEKSRRTELASGVMQMGQRSYVPQLGRFISMDPVAGGSANPYDYALQDPVNGLDVEGTCAKKKCRAARAISASHHVARTPHAAHASTTCGCGGGTGGSPAKPFHVASCSIQLNPAEGVYPEGSPVMTVQGSVTYTCTKNAYISAHVYTPQGTGNVFTEHGHPDGILSYAALEPVSDDSIGLCVVVASGGKSKEECGVLVVSGVSAVPIA